jgi:hypothetical protein
MDRLDGAAEALPFVRALNAITPPSALFDSAFSNRS